MSFKRKPTLVQHRKVLEASERLKQATKGYASAMESLLPEGMEFTIDNFRQTFANTAKDFNGVVLNHCFGGDVNVRNMRTNKTRKIGYHVFISALRDGTLSLEYPE